MCQWCEATYGSPRCAGDVPVVCGWIAQVCRGCASGVVGLACLWLDRPGALGMCQWCGGARISVAGSPRCTGDVPVV